MAAKKFPTADRKSKSKTIAPSTVYRWIFDGMPIGDGRRVYLEHIKVGKTIYTSTEALTRFSAAITSQPSCAEERPANRAKDTASKRAEEAGRRLERIGA